MRVRGAACAISLFALALAEDDCADFDPSCAYWAISGECEANADYLHPECAAACGVCGLSLIHI